MIYEGAPSVQLATLAATIVERLQSNYRCLYLNSPPMVAGLRAYLAAAGVDVMAAADRGALVLSSSQDHLGGGDFDVDGMLTMLSDAVTLSLSDGYAGLWACGDMLWEFGGQKNLAKLLAYEVGLEGLFESHPALCGICQYHRDSLPAHAVQIGLYTHQSVYINETLSRLNSHYRKLATLRAEPQRADRWVSEMLDLLSREDASA